MVNITVAEKPRHAEYFEIVFEIYYKVAGFMVIPNVYDIYGEYSTRVDREIIQLQAKEYPDDVYDGNPAKLPKNLIPDYMKANLAHYIGMPLDINYDIIRNILDDHQMFYVFDYEYFNSSTKEVW